MTDKPGKRERLRAQLREAGLRSTGARLAVLEVLEKATAPLSHADVYEAAASDGFDRATIYRNLIDLTEAGLVSRADVGDHVWRFELRGDHPKTHGHFVCVDCGDVSCLPEAVRVSSRSGRMPRAIEDREFELQIKGVCDRCA